MHKELGAVRQEMSVMQMELSAIRKEMTKMRKEFGGVREEMQALKGHVTVLVGKSSTQNDRIAEAVSLLMMMIKWLREKFPEPQMTLSVGPSSVPKQPQQGSSALQLPPPASEPLTAQSASKPVSVRKPVSTRSAKEENKPESPARKKAKVTRSYVPPQLGSHGSQAPN